MTLAFTFSLSIVAPPSPDPDHAFDTDAAMSRLTRILGDERPHPVDTEANDAVRERLLTEIRTLGFEPIVRDDFYCTRHFGGICGRVRNVMFWAVPPADDTTQGVALMSHYDSVPAGPGAGDDGSGVAVGLEIARILKGRSDIRPVLVLITDGEEIGLLGAESFVYSDPLAARIASVVNVEARGVRGPISMFQTSSPNGRDIAALAKTGRTAMANTLSSDIYDAMPNDTDLSRFLDDDAPREVDGTNFAFILGDSFYHTPGDNLANLDQGSVFHAGVNALAAVESFASLSPASATESDRLYFDILTRGVISVPAWTGLTAIILSGLLAVAALVKTATWRGWRGWVILPLAFIGAGVATFALAAGLGLIKSGAAYSPAHPWALRGALSALAVLIAAVVATQLRRVSDDSEADAKARRGALLKSWLWLSVLAGVGWVLFAGSVTVFAATLFIASLSIIAGLLKQNRLMLGLSLFAALAFILVNLSMPGFALAALGGMAAPFAALWAIPAVIVVLALTTHKATRRSFGALAGLTAVLTIAALVVPTHTVKAPRGLSIEHISTHAGDFVRLSDQDKPPREMMNSGDPNRSETFVFGNPIDAGIPAYTYQRWTRSAPTTPDVSADIIVVSDSVDAGMRQLSLRVNAPTADRLQIAPPSRDTIWTSLTINGTKATPNWWGTRIAGRSARDALITITLPVDQPVGQIAITRFGLGDDMSDLKNARPDWATPRQDGDTRVLIMDLEPQ